MSTKSPREEAGSADQRDAEITSAARWPAASALVIIGAMYLIISDRYSFGPSWLVLALILALLVPITLTRRSGAFHITHKLALAAVALVTLAVVSSAVFLVAELLQRESNGTPISPFTLLGDAALIWLANILTFALWYWEIDNDGPSHREHHGYHTIDFLFPQMTLEHDSEQHWLPGFVDYLFLAFNTSTAFSPTDTMVLSTRAKLLMMAQSLVSLVVIAVLAARAINTLPGG